MANSMNAGANELKRANFGSNLEQWKAKYEIGWSVATFQRRDVPTSRRLNVVTLGQPIQQSTSSNVATSARDLPSIIKSSKGSEFGGIGRRTNEGTEFQSSSDTDFKEVSVICIVSHFWILE